MICIAISLSGCRATHAMGTHGVDTKFTGWFCVVDFDGVGLGHDDFLICSACHFSIQSEGQAIALAPSWIGCGNRRFATRRYISLLDKPTIWVRSFIRIKHLYVGRALFIIASQMLCPKNGRGISLCTFAKLKMS